MRIPYKCCIIIIIDIHSGEEHYFPVFCLSTHSFLPSSSSFNLIVSSFIVLGLKNIIPLAMVSMFSYSFS